MDSKRIGYKIKELRKIKGLSQEEFGDLVDGANKSLVSRWENGVSLPNNYRQKLIAEMANEDVREFFEENHNEPSINTNDVKIYLKQFKKKWDETIDYQSKQYSESFIKIAKELDTQEMEYELVTEIISLPDIIEVDYDGTEFIGDSEEFKKEFITSKIDQIINKKLNTLTHTTPSDDAEILQNVKHNIIKIEETVKSYYLDETEDKVNNPDLNLETYYKISNVLKDTIFNLVRLEEYN